MYEDSGQEKGGRGNSYRNRKRTWGKKKTRIMETRTGEVFKRSVVSDVEKESSGWGNKECLGFHILFFFFLSMAAPVAYGSSRARG